MALNIKKKTKLPLIILIQLLVGFGASMFTLYLFLELVVNLQSIQEFDVFLSLLFYESRSPELTSIMFLTTLLGHEVMLVLLVIVFLIAVLKKHKREALMIVVIFIVGVLLNLLLKEVIGRERPSIAPLLDERFYSFPSGHAMNAFVFYITVVLYIYRITRKIPLTLLSLFASGVVISLVGISRIYLGVHYLTDVIAGFIAGFWWITTSLIIEKSIYLLQSRKKRST